MKNSLSLLSVLFITTSLTVSCSGRRVGSDSTEEIGKEQKIENLSSSLSQAQSRIEELDAKVLALTDKLEAAQVTLDNISGGKNLKTEVLGSATTTAIPVAEAHEKSAAHKAEPHSEIEPAAQTDNNPALALFNKAMGLYKNGKYSESVLVFNQFTEQYPENILAGSAQFHTGEAYFMMGEFKLAQPEYSKVISSFPSSPRVASSLVRISQCQQKTGNKNLSSQTLLLAQETYKGNPSLELGDTVEIAKAPVQTSETKQLPVSPMIPETKKQNNTEDAELDLIKE
jgi:TolA-binding protein